MINQFFPIKIDLYTSNIACYLKYYKMNEMTEPPSIFSPFSNLSKIKYDKPPVYHINIVYRLITEMMVFYIIGASITSYFDNVIKLVFYTSAIMTFILMYMAYITNTEPMKYIMCMSFSTVLGLNGGYIMRHFYYDHNDIFISAIALTFTTFFTFTAVSYYTNNTSVLEVHGFLLSMLFGLIVIGFINIAFPFSETFSYLYTIISLLVFCGFVVHDTVKMHDCFQKQNYDYYKHAINLFLDLLNILLDILKLLSSQKNKKSNKKK